MEAVLDLYDPDSNKAQPLILDCGCGMGTYASELSNESYVGLDVNFSSIKLAHNIHHNNMFIVGDATELPFKDQIFDYVICSEVLEHIPNDVVVLAELARVTKVSGRLIVSVPNMGCRNVFVDWQRSLIDEEVGHYRRGYRFSDISRILARSGFRIRKNRYNCGPVTAIMECFVIILGGFFGYTPSSLNRLFDDWKSNLEKISLRIYTFLFPLIISLTYLDRLLPKRFRSNIVIMAEK